MTTVRADSPSEESLETLITPWVFNTSFSGCQNLNKLEYTSTVKSKSKLRSQMLDGLGSTRNIVQKTMVDVQKWAFFQFRSNIHFIQKVVKNNTPVPITTKIQKCKIPVKRFPGLGGDYAGSINCEWLDACTRDLSQPAERVILYLHGGAYVFGSRRTHRILTWRLSKYANARVFAINYRLAPQFVYPAQLIDALSAYQYLLESYSPCQISVVGDSAGGGLSTALMLYCRDTGIFPIPGAVGGLCPFFDCSQSLPSWYLNAKTDFLPVTTRDPKYPFTERHQVYVRENNQLTHPYVSPLFASETSTPICPMLIQVGDTERLRDDSLLFKAKFSNSPLQLEIYQDQAHVFQLWGAIDGMSKYAAYRMGTFIGQHTGKTIQSKKPILTPLYIRNEAGFPVESFPDAISVIEDGALRLVEQGIWSLKDNEFTVVEHPSKLDVKV